MSSFEQNIQPLENKVNNIVNDVSDIPEWALVFVECFKGLIAEIKNINDVSQRVLLLEEKCNQLDEKCSMLELLEEKCNQLDEKCTMLENNLNVQEDKINVHKARPTIEKAWTTKYI